MDGLLNSQTSGNDWPVPSSHMIHERVQDTSEVWHTEAADCIFEDLEAQMQLYEREHAANLEDLRRFYVLPTDGSVNEFLNDHRALPQLLIVARPHLRKYFPEAVFALRATTDEFGWENLYVDVLWTGDALDAFRLLDQFGDEWWIVNSRPARGALTFTYRLV